MLKALTCSRDSTGSVFSPENMEIKWIILFFSFQAVNMVYLCSCSFYISIDISSHIKQNATKKITDCIKLNYRIWINTKKKIVSMVRGAINNILPKLYNQYRNLRNYHIYIYSVCMYIYICVRKFLVTIFLRIVRVRLPCIKRIL